MANKKIVFKIPEFPHLSETFIVAQIVTAIKLGYTVQILTRKIIESNANIQSGLIQEYKLLDKVILENYQIPTNKAFRFLKWLFLLIANLKYLSYILKYHREYPNFSLTWLFQWCFFKQFNDAAILHVQYGPNVKPFDVLKKNGFFKPAVIVTFHGHDAFFPLHGYIPYNDFYKDLFENDILITANTPYLAEKIEALGCKAEKIEIIPVAVDTAFFHPDEKPKPESGPLKLITIGRLDKIKGHRYCIEAIAHLVAKGIEVTLTIIGEGEQYPILKKLIADNKLEENVFLLGKMGPSAVRETLWAHDVYLLLAIPLEDGRRESQGLATLEAQACGLPAIVFDSGGVKYTVENGASGFICKEFDVEAVVQKIESLVNDAHLLNSMREKAVTFVASNYSQKIIDQKWKIIYEKLIEDVA